MCFDVSIDFNENYGVGASPIWFLCGAALPFFVSQENKTVAGKHYFVSVFSMICRRSGPNLLST